MVFDEINVSGRGPFGRNQRIRCHRTSTLIAGLPGSGKTTVTKQLIRVFEAGYANEPIPFEEALILSFIDEDYTQLRLKSILRRCLGTHPSETLAALSHHVSGVMRPKMLSGKSKFGHPDEQYFPLVASVSDDDRINVSDACGRDLSDLFIAASEQLVIALSANLAVRDVLGYSEPLVIDGLFGKVDNLLLDSCLWSVLERPEQRVILCHPSVLEAVSLTPDFSLVSDGVSHISNFGDSIYNK